MTAAARTASRHAVLASLSAAAEDLVHVIGRADLHDARIALGLAREQRNRAGHPQDRQAPPP